jgi:hypothetical protein
MRVTGIDPTGSSLDRVALCPASAALPQITEVDDDEQSARHRGTAVHKFLERVAAVGRASALAEVDPKHRDRCESINVAKLADRLKLSTEVAVAYNWREDTARILQPIAPRAYEVSDDEVPATLDLAAYDPKARRVFSGDYKGPRAWLPAPETSMQLGLGALALARIYDADEAEVEYIRILDQGEPRRFNATLDAFGLAAAAQRVRATLELVSEMRTAYEAGGIPNVLEGAHCRYCAARMHCPAKTAGMRALLSGDRRISLREPITPENASKFYAMVRAAKDLLAQAEAATYAYAKLTPIKVRDEEDGAVRYFGEFAREGNDVLDGSKTHAVISKRYGGEVANEVVSMETTKRAIGDAIKKHKPADATQVGELKEILAELEALGGISNPTTTTTTEYTVGKDGAPKARKRAA